MNRTTVSISILVALAAGLGAPAANAAVSTQQAAETLRTVSSAVEQMRIGWGDGDAAPAAKPAPSALSFGEESVNGVALPADSKQLVRSVKKQLGKPITVIRDAPDGGHCDVANADERVIYIFDGASLSGYVADGQEVIDDYETNGVGTLPYGLEFGMSLEDAKAILPHAEQLQTGGGNPRLVDEHVTVSFDGSGALVTVSSETRYCD